MRVHERRSVGGPRPDTLGCRDEGNPLWDPESLWAAGRRALTRDGSGVVQAGALPRVGLDIPPRGALPWEGRTLSGRFIWTFEALGVPGLG